MLGHLEIEPFDELWRRHCVEFDAMGLQPLFPRDAAGSLVRIFVIAVEDIIGDVIALEPRDRGLLGLLVELLKKKEAGEKIEPTKAGPAPRVVNLMDALRASLDAVGKKAPAPSVQARRPAKKKASQK
jgi:hypothetical protein